MNSKDKAIKLDDGKAPFHLIPTEYLFALAENLKFGADKYGAWNWSKGMAWSRCFSACMRHMWAWWGGESVASKSFLFNSKDEETGMSHLWHAASCVLFLICYEEWGVGEDDRFRDNTPKSKPKREGYD